MRKVGRPGQALDQARIVLAHIADAQRDRPGNQGLVRVRSQQGAQTLRRGRRLAEPGGHLE
jgi:hypothetical protein